MENQSYYLGNHYINEGIKPMSNLIKEPIEWICLCHDEEKGRSLLLSKDVLDWELYNDDVDMDNFNSTYMHKLLQDMYEEMFEREEKDLICDTTYGKLFPLSLEEVEKYIPNERDRRAIIKYVDIVAEENEKHLEISIEHDSYWLRITGHTDCEEVPIVGSLGEFDVMHASADEIGVRPAMWCNTKLLKKMNLKNGYNKWHHFWDFDDDNLE